MFYLQLVTYSSHPMKIATKWLSLRRQRKELGRLNKSFPDFNEIYQRCKIGEPLERLAQVLGTISNSNSMRLNILNLLGEKLCRLIMSAYDESRLRHPLTFASHQAIGEAFLILKHAKLHDVKNDMDILFANKGLRKTATRVVETLEVTGPEERQRLHELMLHLMGLDLASRQDAMPPEANALVLKAEEICLHLSARAKAVSTDEFRNSIEGIRAFVMKDWT